MFAYAPGSPDRARLKAALAAVEKEIVEIPCVVGGERIFTGRTFDVVMPHRHRHVVARFHAADADIANRAIRAAMAAKREWAAMPWTARGAVLLKAAELLAGPRRMAMNAATMHGQSKTCHQAEIDAACELIDFLRFNVQYAQDLYKMQPKSGPGVVEHARAAAARGLCLRAHAVQLHGDLRQPPERAGADGQHDRVEAERDADARGLGGVQALRRSGLPAGRHQLHPGPPVRPDQRRARRSEPRRHPLHRLDRRVSHDVAARRREHRQVQGVPAARRRDRRQGLHPRARVGGSGGGRHGDRARRLRVPGPEVLGRIARTSRGACGTR